MIERLETNSEVPCVDSVKPILCSDFGISTGINSQSLDLKIQQRQYLADAIVAAASKLSPGRTRIDIGGFVLADGRRITLLRHWSDTGPDGDFLRRVNSRSCRYFRVSLGPEFNAAHRDHFHFDRGPFWACR